MTPLHPQSTRRSDDSGQIGVGKQKELRQQKELRHTIVNSSDEEEEAERKRQKM